MTKINNTKQTGVGCITLTGVVRTKGGKFRATHTSRLGFAGTITKSSMRELRQELKKVFERQLREECPREEYTLTMRSRLTFTKCNMILNTNSDETTGE